MPPGIELLGLGNDFPSFEEVVPVDCALDVEDGGDSDRSCETPDVFEDCDTFGWSIDIELEGKIGPALGVEGTVEVKRKLELVGIDALGARVRLRKRKRSVRRQLVQIIL